ncbi:thioredoxin domain-containing protein [Lactobacillus sp. Sy-1]|uniref:thioredoxin domain-containing protein n=1 Tax=Lactobacillus sp. Sy-1 TaxID=2109645 RepID=UPI001C5AA587|nr:thioredoxin domain-containing protein [Lactobacillus sp. Sy-1]MBW1606238.1 thioredoxin domain-containing protein [Lactobacillus sp. Sy-1]
MSLDLSDKNTLTFGDVNAPHEVTVITNMACPFCRKWYENNFDQLQSEVKSGKLLAHFKFLDKDKLDLQDGNLAHEYIDYSNPEQAIDFVKKAFDIQPEWHRLPKDEAEAFLTSHFDIQKVNDTEFLAAVKSNIESIEVPSVPTIIYDGEGHADSNFTLPD